MYKFLQVDGQPHSIVLCIGEFISTNLEYFYISWAHVFLHLDDPIHTATHHRDHTLLIPKRSHTALTHQQIHNLLYINKFTYINTIFYISTTPHTIFYPSTRTHRTHQQPAIFFFLHLNNTTHFTERYKQLLWMENADKASYTIHPGCKDARAAINPQLRVPHSHHPLKSVNVRMETEI